ncbi:MAG: DUF3575 domain-containing protein [Cyclobacteriaceae bacterium]|nr:DUF3575 domain-containing protein [Cyclobacteriaceae bacterium HetDA_MAG_MS6]
MKIISSAKTAKVTLMALITILFVTASGFAQEKKNAIKAPPLGLILGFGKISYERALSEQTSAQLGVRFFSFDFDGTKFSGYGFIPEYRIYLGEPQAIEGFYAAPFAAFNSFSLKDGDSKATLSVFGGGGKVGWNWLLGKRNSFVIDLAFGARYVDGNIKVDSGSEDDFETGLWTGFRPELNFGIGFAF